MQWIWEYVEEASVRLAFQPEYIGGEGLVLV